ncbi:hypothetical protein KP509_31G055400 [Ceratopteris richardii]|uniref:BHLH domain-containing protein n=1 Tax=Ceratopteris richardii TaxID=49495 RepID=A0A8T2R0E3_CERRI|nr:hypothetical protein KP509_31G055400 [Ceratopteris richardii]
MRNPTFFSTELENWLAEYNFSEEVAPWQEEFFASPAQIQSACSDLFKAQPCNSESGRIEAGLVNPGAAQAEADLTNDEFGTFNELSVPGNVRRDKHHSRVSSRPNAIHGHLIEEVMKSSYTEPLPLDGSQAQVQSSRAPRRKGTQSYREAHIHSERQRRQGMSSLFNTLRSLLPCTQIDKHFKGDRCTLLGHVIEYVHWLEKKLQELEALRADLKRRHDENLEAIYGCTQVMPSSTKKNMAPRASPSSVSVQFWSHADIFITLNSPKQRGLWPQLLGLLQDTLQLDVRNVTLSATPLFYVHSIYAKVAHENQHEVSSNELEYMLQELISAY